MKKVFAISLVVLCFAVLPLVTHADISDDSSKIIGFFQKITSFLGSGPNTAQVATSPAITFCNDFEHKFGIGDSSASVKDLQALIFVFNTEGISAPKQFFTFDEDFASSIIDFQIKYGIKKTGYLTGPTIEKLNSLYGCANRAPNIKSVTFGPAPFGTGEPSVLTINGERFNSVNTIVFDDDTGNPRYIQQGTSDPTYIRLYRVETEQNIKPGLYRVSIANPGFGSSNIVEVKIIESFGGVISSPKDGVNVDAGSSVDFTAAASGGSGFYRYAWDFGDSGTTQTTVDFISSTTPNKISHIFNTAGTFVVKLKIEDSKGEVFNVVPVNVVVLGLPSITFVSPVKGDKFVVGQSIPIKWRYVGPESDQNYNVVTLHNVRSGKNIQLGMTSDYKDGTSRLINDSSYKYVLGGDEANNNYFAFLVDIGRKDGENTGTPITSAYTENFTIKPDQCKDSDGGKSPEVAGIADNRVDGLGSYFKDREATSNGTACSAETCTAVVEGYCSNGEVTNELITCKSGRSYNGACVLPESTATIEIANASAVPARNIPIIVPNQILGAFNTTIAGEPIKVDSMTFTISSTTGSGAGLLSQVSLVDQSGTVLAGPVDAIYLTNLHQRVTFNDAVTFPIGTRTFFVKGTVPNTIGGGGTYIVKTTPASQWTGVVGATSGGSVNLAGLTTQVVSNTVTVKGAALSVNVSSTPASQTISAGSAGVIFTNYLLDATQSSEDVRVTSMPLSVNMNYGGDYPDLTNCQLFDGSIVLNTGANVVNPSVAGAGTEVFTFNAPLIISKATVKTITLKCNVSANASGAYAWGITNARIASISAVGVTSGNVVSVTNGSVGGGALYGGTMTIGNLGSAISVSTDSVSPAYTVAAAGAANVTIGAAKITATGESVRLTRIGLRLSDPSSLPRDLVQVSLYNGLTKIGTAVFVGINRFATSTLDVPLIIGKDTSMTITIKGDLSDISVSSPVTVSGHLVVVDVDGQNTQGVGVTSGNLFMASGQSAVAGVRVFNSLPTIALDTTALSSNLAFGSGAKLLRFKVTANTAGPIGISQFKFDLVPMNINVSAVNLFGYEDSSYSQPISQVAPSGQISSSNQNLPATNNVITIKANSSSGTLVAVQIPAGQTRYFELRGTVSPTASTTYAITSTLRGDDQYLGMLSADMIASQGGNFVWSPNSINTSNLSALDWTNGFGLSGLSRTGVSFTATGAEGGSTSSGDSNTTAVPLTATATTREPDVIISSYQASTLAAPTVAGVTASLVSANENKAGAWGNFAPGTGNTGIYGYTSYDWKWKLDLALPAGSSEIIDSIILFHGGEIWSTANSAFYPLVVVKDDNQLNSSYTTQMGLGPYSAGTHTFNLYGQMEAKSFGGGNVMVTLRSGKRLSVAIPASSIKPPVSTSFVPNNNLGAVFEGLRVRSAQINYQFGK